MMKKEQQSKAVNYMNIKDVKLSEVTFEFYQNSDTWQAVDDGQTLKVSTPDGGGGCYVVIETERWAIDADEIDKFADCLKRIVSMPEGDK